VRVEGWGQISILESPVKGRVWKIEI